MKKIIICMICAIMYAPIFAQTPQAFKYQTIVRNDTGTVLNNKLVSFQIGIIRDSILQIPSYYEIHKVQTNEFGLVSLEIGTGTTMYGQFDTINWGGDDYHLEIGLDTIGGSSFILMGTTQLLAVPYALYSENTINKDDEDWTRAGNYIYTISDSVGIGTSTPGAKLDVAGNIMQSNTGGSVFIGEGAGFLDDLSVKNNVAIGSYALYNNTDRAGLVAIGDSALFNNSIGTLYAEWGTKNTAVGSNAMFSNTTGSSNTAVGRKAMYANTTGTKNTALGVSSLLNNTTGHSNTAVGRSSMYSNITGTNNTAVGYTSLIANETGSGNTAVGKSALYFNINGGDNIAIGTHAMYSNTSGSSNTACGILALGSNESGILNSAYGAFSLENNQDGNNNTALGFQALWGNESGNSNIAIGIRALYNSYDPSNLVAIGDSALYNNGYGATLPDHGKANTAIGSKTLYSNTLGYRNTALGYNSLYANITGFNNIALGYQTMYYNDNGNNNVAVGDKAMLSNIIGSNNVAIGYEASYSFIDGNYNTAIGYNAGWENFSGDGNIFLGSYAGYYEAGSNKLYIENSDSDKNNALIYGEFDNNLLTFNANVGIGTTTPFAKLEIMGDLPGLQPNIRSYGDIHLGNGATSGGGIYFGNGGYSWTTGDYIRQTAPGRIEIIAGGTNAGTQLVVNSGKVGIGTSNPGKQLEISHTDDAWLRIAADSDNSGGDDGTQNAYLQFTTDNNAEDYDGLIWLENLSGDTKLHFDVENQEVMVFSNGRIGMGTDSPLASVSNSPVLVTDGTKTTAPTGINWQINDYGGYALGVENVATGGSGLLVDAGNNSGTGATVANFVSSNNSLMIIREDGNVGIGTTTLGEIFNVYNGSTTGTYTTSGWQHSSDLRLKTNISQIDHALEKVMQMEGVYFNWKNDPGDNQVGLIAQEVEKVLPEVVNTDDEGFYSMSYGAIVPVLIEAVKEQQNTIEKLENNIEELKAIISEMK